MADKAGPADKPVTIKKYANRRLYNQATSKYVTLEHLSQMVKDGVEFVVVDAKTGEDLTRAVLTQIIVEEEAKSGQTLLPINFLRQLIQFYGDSLQSVLPRYLEQSMQVFTKNQDQMRSYMRNAMGGFFPFPGFEEMGRQNMAMFENALNMFTGSATKDTGDDAPGKSGSAPPAGGNADQVDDLRRQLERMQRQLNELTEGRRRGD
jgi:polyhydroxyalkanoate synthesis repressor PhaR